MVKIHLLVQKITQKQIYVNEEPDKFDISKCWCDLENKVKVTKILSTPNVLLTKYLCKFGQNSSTGSEDSVWKWLTFTVFIG